MPFDFRRIIEAARNLHIELSSEEKRRLARSCAELERWNQKINLTALRGAELVRKLVVEPVWIAKELEMTGVLVDIGSGNGSPAIPMAVVSKLTAVHLVEARVKRAAFLRHVIATLGLHTVQVHKSRFEDLGGSLGPANWITLQAVALTTELFETIKLSAISTTTVVWMTSAEVTPPIPPTRRVKTPITGREILLFRLDHS
ncbi:MAG: class I SAM-dependent methyltransferase [Acidobacteria bacterium]|nr:class I SAM-dependent methyltransferase [Acidobacteriota bacterium]